jgi:hypothetical protein
MMGSNAKSQHRLNATIDACAIKICVKNTGIATSIPEFFVTVHDFGSGSVSSDSGNVIQKKCPKFRFECVVHVRILRFRTFEVASVREKPAAAAKAVHESATGAQSPRGHRSPGDLDSMTGVIPKDVPDPIAFHFNAPRV